MRGKNHYKRAVLYFTYYVRASAIQFIAHRKSLPSVPHLATRKTITIGAMTVMTDSEELVCLISPVKPLFKANFALS